MVGYLMPNPFYANIQICMIWFGEILWDINHYYLSNAKSSLYIYIKYIGFDLINLVFMATVGYLMANHLYINKLNIYDLV